MNEETTEEYGLQKTAAYIVVGMPDGSRSTSDLLQLHVDAIKAATQDGISPAEAVALLIEKGVNADEYAHRVMVAANLGGMNIPRN